MAIRERPIDHDFPIAVNRSAFGKLPRSAAAVRDVANDVGRNLLRMEVEDHELAAYRGSPIDACGMSDNADSRCGQPAGLAGEVGHASLGHKELCTSVVGIDRSLGLDALPQTAQQEDQHHGEANREHSDNQSAPVSHQIAASETNPTPSSEHLHSVVSRTAEIPGCGHDSLGARWWAAMRGSATKSPMVAPTMMMKPMRAAIAA